ncbi:MAG: Mur ligase family protein, partial [Chloroflexota bacterium]|nr:Mur ligase family protein [Chloroflexota bacterium]
SAAALLAAHAGAVVSGCDPGGSSPYTSALAAAEIPLAWQHSADHVVGPAGAKVERLAVSKALTAIDPDNAELAAARRLAIRAEPWQQVVADACATAGQALVAVAGTHGKSTTTGWLVHLLVTAGRDPSAFVGALLEPALAGGRPATARWGRGDQFVVEADEYAGNFDPYRPDVALLLNVEWDHPDVFADRAAVVDAFATWLRRAEQPARPTLVANVGDAGAAEVVDRLAGWSGRVLDVALDGGEAAISATIERLDAAGSELRVRRRGEADAVFPIGLVGRHNAANALLVVGAAQVMGIDDGALRRSLATFSGVGRRLELKGDTAGVAVLDDYGHHPTAIARTLEAVRQRYPGRRLWAVYEPLTYHRTAVMLEPFAEALAGADAVAVADIWAGRDPDTSITSSAALAAAVAARGRPAVAAGSVEATAEYLARAVESGDVVLVMGGGRSYVIAERLVALLGGAAR